MQHSTDLGVRHVSYRTRKIGKSWYVLFSVRRPWDDGSTRGIERYAAIELGLSGEMEPSVV